MPVLSIHRTLQPGYSEFARIVHDEALDDFTEGDRRRRREIMKLFNRAGFTSSTPPRGRTVFTGPVHMPVLSVTSSISGSQGFSVVAASITIAVSAIRGTMITDIAIISVFIHHNLGTESQEAL
jgi:hypothetical protein